MGLFNRKPKRVLTYRRYPAQIRNEQVWTLVTLRSSGLKARQVNPIARGRSIFDGITTQTLSSRNRRAKKIIDWLEMNGFQIVNTRV